MLDFLRGLRGIVNYFSEMSILGIHIDWFFHLMGVAFLVVLAAQFLKLRKAIQLAVAAIIFKEVFDIFAKTRLDYIRPPTLDIIFHLTAGVLGIFLGIWVAKTIRREGWLMKWVKK